MLKAVDGTAHQNDWIIWTSIVLNINFKFKLFLNIGLPFKLETADCLIRLQHQQSYSSWMKDKQPFLLTNPLPLPSISMNQLIHFLFFKSDVYKVSSTGTVTFLSLSSLVRYLRKCTRHSVPRAVFGRQNRHKYNQKWRSGLFISCNLMPLLNIKT